MPDRLTLNSTRQSDQAANPDDKPARASGQRQPQELQTAFMDGIFDQVVTVYLINGLRLTGTVRQHDAFTLLLQDTDGIDALLFKHAISTILPGAPVVTRERQTPFGKRPEWSG